jgi:hypothetical protein
VKHQKVIASGTVDINGEERDKFLVFQLGCSWRSMRRLKAIRFGMVAMLKLIDEAGGVGWLEMS